MEKPLNLQAGNLTNQASAPFILPPLGQIDGTTQLVGILGFPIAHTLSPEMHNAAFAALGMNWRYLPLLVRPEMIGQALRGAAALGFRGLNLTVPHKVNAIQYLDSVTEAVTIVGAVNTIRVEMSSGRLEGLNTDVTGFLADLAAHKVSVGEQNHVVILGAGGAARAVGTGLARSGARLTFVNRTPEKAIQIAEFMRSSWSSGKIDHATFGQLAEVTADANLIVNCTPVGIYPDVELSPWPEDVPIPKTAVIYDTVYRPQRTRLMKQAELAGCQVIGGLGMLVYQGAAAFEVWTGKKPPIEVMRQVCEIRLGAM